MLKDYQKALCKDIQNLGYKYGMSKVFCDFVECVAITLSNMVDPLHREKREERYCEIIKNYTELEERQKFAEMFACLVNALDNNVTSGKGPEDVLGPVFHELELHNEYKGQFFTPQNVSDMMALISVGGHDKVIEEKGYVSVCEPACGSGTMILSFAKALMNEKYNYNRQMVATATDVDIKCVHMAYIQLSLYGIPAVVIHGNTLTLEEWSRWYTPVYITDNWLWRQTCGNKGGIYADDESLKMIFSPQYAAIRKIFSYGSKTEKPKESKSNIKNEKATNTVEPEFKNNKEPVLTMSESKGGQLKFDF